MELVVRIYELTHLLPKNEQYGLASQMQRAAVSIPSNIAEGAGRNSIKEYIRFLYISHASLNELASQYQICLALKLCPADHDLYDMIDHVGRLLMNLIKSLNK